MGKGGYLNDLHRLVARDFSRQDFLDALNVGTGIEVLARWTAALRFSQCNKTSPISLCMITMAFLTEMHTIDSQEQRVQRR